MKKILRLSIVLILLSVNLIAQDTTSTAPPPGSRRDKEPFKDRLFFGGNLGLYFGSLTYINISPTIGYRFSERIGAGLGPAYSYYSDKRDSKYTYTTNTYGGRLFGQYLISDQLMAYTEYEMINVEVPDLLYTKLIRKNISSLFVGGGYLQRIGNGNSGISLMILYNVIETDYNIYENPIIRTGINIGF
ncbi:MAG: hypothetical protein U0Y08_06860 [Bacteroidia bacterium]